MLRNNRNIYLGTILLLSSCAADIPEISKNVMAFGVEDSWKAASRYAGRSAAVDSGTKKMFDVKDRIGMFAYWLDDGVMDLTVKTADIMANCPMQYEENGVWSYSPPRYWSYDQADKFRFCSYWPFGTDCMEVSAEKPGLPRLTYTVTGLEAAQTDVMVSDQMAKYRYEEGEKFLLDFHHIMGKFVFKIRMVAPDGSDINAESSNVYSALVQQIKLTVPVSGVFGWQWMDEERKYPVWEVSDERCELNLLTPNPAGIVVDSSEPKILDDFTAFLLPGTLNSLALTINNVPREHALNNVKIEAGKITVITATIIASENKEYDDALFHATYSRWEEGGIITGDLQ